jgi:hypothetical protein
MLLMILMFHMVFIVFKVIFCKTILLSSGLAKKMQELEVVASLTWVGFIELLVERFMLNQILHEEMCK